LKAGFQLHQEQTNSRSHGWTGFDALGQKPETSTTCEAMKGIIKEGQIS
jgi:ferritin-like metal-binding protein YciE